MKKPKPPDALSQIAEKVLAYRPKPKSKAAKNVRGGPGDMHEVSDDCCPLGEVCEECRHWYEPANCEADFIGDFTDWSYDF